MMSETVKGPGRDSHHPDIKKGYEKWVVDAIYEAAYRDRSGLDKSLIGHSLCLEELEMDSLDSTRLTLELENAFDQMRIEIDLEGKYFETSEKVKVVIDYVRNKLDSLGISDVPYPLSKPMSNKSKSIFKRLDDFYNLLLK